MTEVNAAAGEYADEYADYDDEYDYHQRLVSDEDFGTIAYHLSGLGTLQRYSGSDLGDDASDSIRRARHKLRDALDARAEELKFD